MAEVKEQIAEVEKLLADFSVTKEADDIAQLKQERDEALWGLAQMKELIVKYLDKIRAERKG